MVAAEDVEELCSAAIEDGGCVVLMGKTGRIETRESAQSSGTIKDLQGRTRLVLIAHIDIGQYNNI